MSSSSMHPVRGARSPQARRAQEFASQPTRRAKRLSRCCGRYRGCRGTMIHRLVDSSSRLSARFPPRSGRGHRSAQGPKRWLSSLCDLSTRWRSAIRAITRLRQIWFAVLWSTVEAGSFLFTVFDDFGTDEWRKMLRSQHTFDQLLGKPIILMASL
jgi:hypothetical protein